MDIINIIFAFLSIGLGMFGWLAPRFTMKTLNLSDHTDTMGISEISASAGALFVGMGVGALLLRVPEAFLMIGFCWIGAAIGRLTSIIRDGATSKKWVFFFVETAVGLSALIYNF